MKRFILPIVLTLFLISSFNLSAKRLLIWMSDDKDYRIVYQPIITNYGRKNNIKIDIEYFTLLELRNTFISGIESGSGPDIFWCVNDWLGELVALDGIYSLDKMISKKDKSRFLDNAVKAVTVDGKMYSYPIAVDSLIMYYNKDILPDGTPDFLEDIIEETEKIHNADKNIYGYGFDYSSSYYMSPVFLAFDSEILTEDKLLTLNSDKALNAVKFMHGIVYSNQSIPKITNREALLEMLFNDTLSVVITGTWELNKLISTNNLDKIGVSILPKVKETGLRMQPLNGIQGFAISNLSRYKKEAYGLIEYMGSENVQKHFVKKSYLIPAVKNFSELVEPKVKGFYSVFEKQFENGYPMPNDNEMKYYWAGMSQAYKKIMLNEEFDGSRLKAVGDKMNGRIMNKR